MNEDNATFADVMGLIRLVKETVRERFGVSLQEEVRIISRIRASIFRRSGVVQFQRHSRLNTLSEFAIKRILVPRRFEGVRAQSLR